MGRPLKPIDPSSPQLAALAHDLRDLRASAGEPTLDSMARKTGLSKSVLSGAMSGRSLPQARTVEAFVRVCGGDVDVWLARREQVAEKMALERELALAAARKKDSGNGAQDGDADESSDHDESAMPGVQLDPADVEARRATSRDLIRRLRRTRRRRAVVSITAAVLIGAVVGASGIYAMARTGALDIPAPSQVRTDVATGDDPMVAECGDDAISITGDTMPDPNIVFEIRYSKSCEARWARLTRYDGMFEGETVTLTMYEQDDPDKKPLVETVGQDAQVTYSDMVVGPPGGFPVCAIATFTQNGKEMEFRQPICA